MKFIKKLLCIIGLLLIFSNTSVFASAAFFYPKNYVLTINNINKLKIKNIEIIYNQNRYGFNYSDKDTRRNWILYTDFGYKYKDYSDKDIIPTLSPEEIDAIAMANIGVDTSKINGYWIESSVCKAANTSITKFTINENININYNFNNIVISYSSDEKSHNPYINSMILRITKNDNTIIYSDFISSNMVGVADEFSSRSEYQEAKTVSNKTAYFEVDFNEIENNFKVLEVSEPNTKNIISNYTYTIILLLIIILITILFIKLKKKTSKN